MISDVLSDAAVGIRDYLIPGEPLQEFYIQQSGHLRVLLAIMDHARAVYDEGWEHGPEKPIIDADTLRSLADWLDNQSLPFPLAEDYPFEKVLDGTWKQVIPE